MGKELAAKCRKCGKEIVNGYTLCYMCKQKSYNINEFGFFKPAVNESKTKKKRIPWSKAVIFSSLIFYLFAFFLLTKNMVYSIKFCIASNNFSRHEYLVAAKQFDELDGFYTSEEMLLKCYRSLAEGYIKDAKYKEALEAIEHMPQQEKYQDLKKEASYQLGIQYLHERRYASAIDIFFTLDTYKECKALLDKAKFQRVTQYSEGDISQSELIKSLVR